jgi:glycosyltransferase involved in cell wall biosynthesis
MRKIKIVHIITRLILGGAQENTILTLEGLKSRNPSYKVLLLSGPPIGPEGELLERVKNSNIDLILVRELRRNINPFFDLVAFMKLCILLLREKPDIIHTHSSKAGILGRWAGWLTGAKIILHTIHGLPFHDYQHRIVNLLYRTLEIFTSKITTAFITVGRVMKEKALKAGLGRSEKFHIIYSGIEVGKFLKGMTFGEDLRRSLGIVDKFVIGSISRLAPLKGHEYLFDAFTELKVKYSNLSLLIVGDGLFREKFQRIVKEKGIEKDVIFMGLIKQERIPAVISAMDLLVHTSLREGLPRAVVQALILEKPVVSFDIDGACEVVKSPGGYLVPAGDRSSLANAIENAIKGERPKMEDILVLRERFDHQKMVDEIEKLYRELLKKI